MTAWVGTEEGCWDGERDGMFVVGAWVGTLKGRGDDNGIRTGILEGKKEVAAVVQGCCVGRSEGGRDGPSVKELEVSFSS